MGASCDFKVGPCPRFGTLLSIAPDPPSPMTDSQENDAPTVAKDEVLRRIGRNLLLFQHIEQLLKRLLEMRVQGTLETFERNIKKRQAKVHAQTLGQLATLFVEDILSDAGDSDETGVHDQPTMSSISFTFSSPADRAYIEQYSVEMKAVLKARNDLVHQFLPRWKPTCAKSTEAALAQLDADHALALPMRDRLKCYAESLTEILDETIKALSSPETLRQLEMIHLRHSQLALMLGEITLQAARADGWTVLSTASQIVAVHAPDEFRQMAKRYGHRTLKKFMLATELFDFMEEATPKGGVRVLYRINPRFTLGPNSAPADADLLTEESTLRSK